MRKNVIFAYFVWRTERCRRTLAYIFQTNHIILMKFWHFLRNEMTNHHISKLDHFIDILNPDFELFEVSDFTSGDRSCVGFSDSPKSDFFEDLVATFHLKPISTKSYKKNLKIFFLKKVFIIYLSFSISNSNFQFKVDRIM